MTTPLTSIDIDIGKEVFHIVGFGTDGEIAFKCCNTLASCCLRVRT